MPDWHCTCARFSSLESRHITRWPVQFSPSLLTANPIRQRLLYSTFSNHRYRLFFIVFDPRLGADATFPKRSC